MTHTALLYNDALQNCYQNCFRVVTCRNLIYFLYQSWCLFVDYIPQAEKVELKFYKARQYSYIHIVYEYKCEAQDT